MRVQVPQDIVIRVMTDSTAEPAVRAHILVSGRVQGVGYRAFAARAASQHGVLGGVRNLEDGRVELHVEGEKAVIETLVRELKKGPSAARVTNVDTEWSAATGRFVSFSIWY